MAEAEIHYFIKNASENQADLEKVLAAVGAYQDTVDFTVRHTAEISEEADDAVFIKLARTVRNTKQYAKVLEVADSMNKGVIEQFPPEDRERLSKLFAGIALSGELETE
ncbi:MAG: hypothetical protein JWM52_348 [Candidatus Saccharibacteria bacterium]|nr:hypothetical protein [Candidatus Saccharibacteria bacterium]